ncbi:MAG: Coq4 family protein [Cyanobacteria bacterium J06638_22]
MRFQQVQAQLLDGLMTLRGVILLLANPSNTLSVYDIEDGLRRDKGTQLSVTYLLAQPGVAELAKERYLAPTPSLEQLRQCPDESLGRAYASYIEGNGFDPTFYRQLEINDDTSYLFMRRRQTHDIWHLLTGMGIDAASELGLKAFELAQTRGMMAGLLLAGGLIRTLLKEPDDLPYLLDRIAIGYRMGMQAKPFMAQKWEEGWDQSVEEWRNQLNVIVPAAYVP